MSRRALVPLDLANEDDVEGGDVVEADASTKMEGG